jgi:hypothetical protein
LHLDFTAYQAMDEMKRWSWLNKKRRTKGVCNIDGGL